MLQHIAPALAKRALAARGSSEIEVELPPWVFLVILANIFLIIPPLLVVSYTFKVVFPTLAIIEDQNPPPAYQPVPLNGATADNEDPSISKTTDGPPATPPTGPVTSSLRATWKLLRSQGGKFSVLRGFWPLMFLSLAQGVLYSILRSPVPTIFRPFAYIASHLCLASFAAAWVHVVSTPKNERSFFRRLPRFGKAFKATAPALALYSAAEFFTNAGPMFVAYLGGVEMPDPMNGDIDFSKHYTGWRDASHSALLSLAITVIPLLGWFAFMIPANAIMVRVQASLLPADEHTIVPFDRSFGGKVGPEVVDGKGFATVKQVWATFEKASWKRLYILYFKLFLVDVATAVVLFGIVLPQVWIIKSITQQK